MGSDHGHDWVNDDTARYQAVAARRLQFDNQMWQVPVLSLTAQAFLFTIALGTGSSSLARCAASMLSSVTAAVSMILMAGHRRSELCDADWLANYEENRWGKESVAHGKTFKENRDTTPMYTDAKPTLPTWFFARFALRGTFNYWMGCLFIFGVAGLIVFVLAIVAPTIFS